MLEPDYFAKKRQQLGMDRGDILVAIQTTLDTWYPGYTRAKRLHQGVLRVVTTSSSVASELRLRQAELLGLHALVQTRVSITIGTISD